jgi:hypothetical protein
MMKARIGIAPLLAVALAAPTLAHALTDAETEARLVALSKEIGGDCYSKEARAARSHDATIAICATAISQIVQRRETDSAAPIGVHSVYSFWESALRTIRAEAMAKADGVRSARVCLESEEAWRALYRVNLASIGPTSAQVVRETRTGSRPLIELCRSENGKPDWAWPLSELN